MDWNWTSSPTRQKDCQANWQHRAPTLRKRRGPKWYTDSNHCFLIITSRQSPQNRQKLFLLDTSSTAFVIKDFVVTVLMYLRAEIIFAFGKLHPVVGKLQPSLWWTSTSTMMLFSSVKTKGNSSFPDVLCVCLLGAVRLQSFSFFYFLFLFVSYQPRLLFVSLPLSVSPSQPPICTASLLFPLSFSQTVPQPWIATVLSIFNYDHTVQGFESLSCRAGRFLITKLISKWAEKMTSAGSSRFMLPCEVIGQGKNNTGCSIHPCVLFCL